MGHSQLITGPQYGPVCSGLPSPSLCSQGWWGRCPPLKDLRAQPGEPVMLAGPQVVRNNWFFEIQDSIKMQ